jgi:TolB-like protein
MANGPVSGKLRGALDGERSGASTVEALPVAPVQPLWRRLWSKLRSRFARQIALVAVVIGTIAAVGHFIGGMIGWWHAYELTFHHGDDARPPTKIPLGQAEPLSIVVLPLTVEGDATDIEWFADALHGDLVSEVATLPGSFVIARETASTFRDGTLDPRDVARELHVRYVVRGSLRREGTVVRLSLTLIDGESGRQRWAEKFTVERAQLSQALDEFVTALGRSLSIEVQRSAGDRSVALSPDEVSADDLAMRAYGLWFRGVTRENLVQAMALLEQAVARNPNSTRAWGGLVFMNLSGILNGWLPDRAAALRRIDEAAVQLDRLDPDSFFGYQAKVVQAFFRKDFPGMLRLSEPWAKNHRNPSAIGGYGMALVFNGRPDEGIAQLERSLRLSPRDVYRAEWQYRLAMAHFMLAQYEQAREWGQTAQASNPGWPWPPIHAAAMSRLGQQAEAKQVLDDFLKRNAGYDVNRIMQRLPGTEARFVEGRDRLVASLRELGMP